MFENQYIEKEKKMISSDEIERVRTQAIKIIHEVQEGNFDRNEIIDEVPRGSIAIRYWNDAVFTLGIEYGVIIGLMMLLDIKRDEV